MSGDEEAERIARARAGQAETLQAVLQERFWLPREHLFRVAEGRRLGWRGPWHHWWQSHALAALLDRWDRTGDPASLAQAEAVVEGMRRRGRGRLTNDFYDDLGWLALALLRMPDRLDDARDLVQVIRRGESPGGGIAWSRQTPEFRNTPATGPATLVALRLGARTNDDELVAWGRSLAGWIAGTLVTPFAEVHDGLRVHPDGTTGVDTAQYSYNFGLVVGVELAMSELTTDAVHLDPTHLDRARLVAAAALRRFSDPATGIWVSEGTGDGALFRGILARHLADLALATGDVDLGDALQAQADAVWTSSGGGPVGHDWSRPCDHPVELSEHVGGLLVVEAAARLADLPRTAGPDTTYTH